MSSNNTRIARNTVSLFFRMLITVLVSLYTSRVVLSVLGVEDYGLYALVGGVVTFFSFISGTMSSSTQRFLNFGKGKEDLDQVKRVFGTSVFVHALIAIGLLALVEGIGLWFLNYKLNIEPERLEAANWVFHVSVLSFVLTIANVPYRSVILANERMSVFAVISIVEVLLKLLVIFVIQWVSGDKLIWYAIMLLVSTVVVNLIYRFYSKSQFQECKGGLKWDSDIAKKLFGFSVWTLISGFSIVLRNQGASVLLNIFFGTVINAAQGIANQINAIIVGFTANFTLSVNPQIVKDYAAGRLDEMRKLVMFSSRIAFVLLLIIALPVVIEADIILSTWLKEVPDYAVFFVRLILIQALVESFASVHGTAQGATGKVKQYHVVLSAVGLLNLPIAYLVLKAGAAPYSVLFISIALSAVISVLRLFFLRKSIELSLRQYAKQVIWRCFLVLAIAVPVPLFLRYQLENTVINAIIICIVSVIMVILTTVVFGVSAKERSSLINKIQKKLPIKFSNDKKTNSKIPAQ
ncbi:lipopolysaccharide biosynthesis protein [Sphingobacterium corticis]|uniref:Lipopolysaccharide biosynthesis protein n=1 Tax=Sphingobacterium corticis TaxID=1812823 RepID=A0ABW5NG34_9SPHI